MLSRQIARGPIILFRNALDLDRDGVASAAQDNNVDSLLVAEGENCGETDPVKAGQNVEFRREVGVVASHWFLDPW